MKVLVFNSDADDCALLLQELSNAAYDSIIVDSLEQARSAMKHQSFDLLLIDSAFPNPNGLHLCNDVREYLGSDMLIIFLVSNSSPADHVVALELGADDVIPKPWNPEELQARIEARLRRLPISRARHLSGEVK